MEELRPRGRVSDSRENTPKWLAEQLGVSDRTVRLALRVKYPRGENMKRQPWGTLSSMQVKEIKEFLGLYPRQIDILKNFSNKDL